MNDIRAIVIEHIIVNKQELLARCGVDFNDMEYNLMFIDDVYCALVHLLVNDLGLNYIDVAANIDQEDVRRLLMEGI